MSEIPQKFLLMILDGWGIGARPEADAILHGNTPFIDGLKKKYPNSKLYTSGESVGLPEGQMGNSEVGHLNIGAGRIVDQDLVRINKAVHLIGLVSDGGVHSSEKHLYKLCEIAEDYNLKNVHIHAITDGRDTDPQSGLNYIKELEDRLTSSTGEIASLVGRYYSMDRDKRWERVKIGYDLYVHGKGEKSNDIISSVKQSYENEITDEFIKPIVKVGADNQPVGIIKPGDVVICFNFRTDRLRELTMVLTQINLPEYDMEILDLEYYTMTRYDDSFKAVNIIYDKENLINTLGQIISDSGFKQIRIAETEKYPHVTFFFSGGRETEFKNEKRILIPSPKVATYDLQPEMSAYLVKDSIVDELKKAEHEFICLNFANGDMVGHTGIWDAIIKAVGTVDNCTEEIVNTARNNGYAVMIISDHGNADNATNVDGSQNTAHSLNPVPCILVSDQYENVKDGILADVAPTILKIMNIDIPQDMTGNPLV